jgi:opine dehydrogenase
VAVIGTGAAGLATAALLAIGGQSVQVANRGPRGLEEIRTAGGIAVENADGSTVTLPVQAATSIGEAVESAEVAILAIGGGAEGELLLDLGPRLGELDLIVSISGRAGSGPTCARAVTAAGVQVTVAEMAFPFVATEERPGAVCIHGRKAWTAIACHPVERGADVLKRVRALFDLEIDLCPSLWPTLHCVPGLTIPLQMLANAGPISRGEKFSFYREGGFREMDRLVDALDRERSLIGEGVGLQTTSSVAWLNRTYGLDCASVSEVFATAPAYALRTAPDTLRHRYLTDHVPLCAVPLALLGRQVGVETPFLDSIATLASAVVGEDLWSLGSARAGWINTLPGAPGGDQFREENEEGWQSALSRV